MRLSRPREVCWLCYSAVVLVGCCTRCVRMIPNNFFTELKRRNVYKIAVAYAVVGWLVIQISSTVLPTFHAPEWVVQTLVVLVLIGLPIALVIAWARSEEHTSELQSRS